MKKVILFNAPAKNGKDCSANYLGSILSTKFNETVIHYKYTFPLKNMVHSMYGLNIPHDFFENRKDEPCEELENRIPRQEYICVSEKLVKPAYGKDFFGRIGANVISKHIENNSFVVISDFGFKEELLPLASKIDPSLVLCVQLEREGYTFEGDSRSYVNSEKFFDTRKIVANDLETLYSELNKLVELYFG
jgi:hypothetical protein